MGQEFQYLRRIQIFYVNSLCPRNANTRHANMYTIWQYSRANKHFGIYKKKENTRPELCRPVKWHYFPRSIKCFPSVIVVTCYDNMFLIIAKRSDFKGNDVYLYFAFLTVVLYYNTILYCTLWNCIRLHCTAPVTLPTFSLFLYNIYVDHFIRSA